MSKHGETTQNPAIEGRAARLNAAAASAIGSVGAQGLTTSELATGRNNATKAPGMPPKEGLTEAQLRTGRT